MSKSINSINVFVITIFIDTSNRRKTKRFHYRTNFFSSTVLFFFMSSSLFIGLHLNACQITATLVRRHSAEPTRLTIERDTSLTRSYQIYSSTDPREIIVIWIDCLEDLLHEFRENFHGQTSLKGIAISTSGPMIDDDGIFLNRDETWRHFFGLNFRLIFENAIRELILRWKTKYPVELNRPKKIFDGKSRRLTINSTSGAADLSFIVNSSIFNENSDGQFSAKSSKIFCGQNDEFDGKSRANSKISELRRESYFHDVEHLSTNETNSTLIDDLSSLMITFHDESTCFGLGESMIEHERNSLRILSLTIGTTFNSTFIDRNEIIRNRDDVPLDGQLGQCPYDQNFTAEEYFSIKTFSSLNSRLERSDPSVLKIFENYARRLGQFLVPFVNGFRTDLILIGGDLAKFWFLIENELISTIRQFSSAEIYFSLSSSKSTCLGAVEEQLRKGKFRRICRQTSQNLLPVVKTIDTSRYDIYPTHRIPIGQIEVGSKKLNEKFVEILSKNAFFLIDGFVGTFFSEFAENFNRFYFETKRKTENVFTSILLFYDSRVFLRRENDFQREIYLKDSKSIFGRVANDFDFRKDFLDEEKFSFLQKNFSSPCVVIGPGASFFDDDAPLFYIDLPKNELYYRITSKTASSILKPRRKFNEENDLSDELYELKCLYFLDFPILNRLKQKLTSRWNFFIDGQRPHCPTWIDGETFRQALAHLSRQPIRLRPWFESSLWGGQFIKETFPHVSKLSKNYGLSYEFVPNENGLILFDDQNRLLEFSWEIFYGEYSKEILGNDQHFRLFGRFDEFPIRMNFLDTIDGANLALQTNPNFRYARNYFGEKLGQDQSFYVVRTKKPFDDEFSSIFLGFRPNVDVNDFRRAISTNDFHIENFVERFPTHDHNFFLVPSQTIFSLGRNQFVIEISSAPRIYSLKLFDWLRLDFDSRPRHLSIEHGLKNLQFDRHGQKLRSQPIRLPSISKHYEEHLLPTHSSHLFNVHRMIVNPDETIEVFRRTENRFELVVLIEGDAIEIRFHHAKQSRIFNIFESFLLPASIGEYSIRPLIKSFDEKTKAKNFLLLFVFLKTDCEKSFQ